MLIITEISNEITIELTTYAILCRNLILFYGREQAFLFQVQEKLKARRNSKLNFLSVCFIEYDSHIKMVW